MPGISKTFGETFKVHASTLRRRDAQTRRGLSDHVGRAEGRIRDRRTEAERHERHEHDPRRVHSSSTGWDRRSARWYWFCTHATSVS